MNDMFDEPLSAASRTPILFQRSVPGVPLRSAPGFMLPAAPRASDIFNDPLLVRPLTYDLRDACGRAERVASQNDPFAGFPGTDTNVLQRKVQGRLPPFAKLRWFRLSQSFLTLGD